MRRITKQMLPIERMTREPEHHFFGYYDLQPWSADGHWHLCHRVAFMDRLPTAADRAELGMIRMSDYQFVPLAATYAWNFQQGAMLQWHPQKPEEIIYNVAFAAAYKTAIKNIRTGDVRFLPRPIASVSPDGRRGLSINFSRLFDFRPGYGYAGIADPFAAASAPAEDGIYLLDIETGAERLIIPLAKIAELFAKKFGGKPPKIVVNHMTFNPAGERFVFLARSMPMPGEKNSGWLTLVATADTEGQNIHIFEGFGSASHYWWRDSERLLIYADRQEAGKIALCLLRDQSQEYEVLDQGFFTFDGHCSYSPDGRFILYDSYPDAEGYRQLFIYDLRKRQPLHLARLFSGRWQDEAIHDIRCDHHPRWNRQGTAISFDSIHEGHRHVYWMDVSSLLA